ncbi:MAG: adenylate/guanylate cyclase domain-containing protein [Chloroflexi bacterium]|nr:adenylate/guanylate cyclase domain-containing protein [Chloroflexota bacterium]
MTIELKQQNKDEFFGHYRGNQYVDQMINGEEELSGNIVFGSIFFANIRDVITTAAESNQPRIIEDLNSFYMRIQHAVHEFGGVVHKCGDDSITALFGAPMPMENHAQQAVAVAFKMMDALMILNRQRIHRKEQPLRVGLGVNSGDLIIGNTTNPHWHSNIVVGQAVNVAAHFSQLNKTTPIHTVFLGETTAKAISLQDEWHVEQLNDVTMADKTAVPLYALLHS